MKKKIYIIGILILLMVGVVSLSGCVYDEISKEYTVLVTDAPDGKYWVHTEGRGGGGFLFFYFHTNSDLRESYTVKFMDGNEYKTLIISSGDPRLHVIFTDDNTSMILHIEAEVKEADLGAQYDNPLDAMNLPIESNGCVYYRDCKYKYEFILYIPKPEICTISDEVI